MYNIGNTKKTNEFLGGDTMKEKILAIIIGSIIVPLIFIIIWAVGCVKEKNTKGEKFPDLVDEFTNTNLPALIWITIVIMLLGIIKLVASSI